MRVVATAGHVDHGKSTLVRALTGTDPDRWAEERARGLTIDLGFAFTTLERSGTEVGFVDVPGHERFARNMLAGVGAVDLAMLVIAADDGWMPQTEEHAMVLELLGVEHGIVVSTKSDLVDDTERRRVRDDITTHLGGRGLARWPIVECDARSGRGVDAVRSALDDLVQTAPPPLDLHRPRLWIDRCFVATGSGTVVTGTLGLGTLAVGDDIVIEPGALHGRIRGIESHGQRLDQARPGTRVALNLAGIDHRQVERGHAVVRPDQWEPASEIDVAIVPVAESALAPRGTVDVHVGAGTWPARQRRLDDTIRRLRLDAALALRPGDRLVLRSSARQAVVAGAVVVDIAPAPKRADALARAALAPITRAALAAPWADPRRLATLCGTDPRDASTHATTAVQRGELVELDGAFLAPHTAAALAERADTLVAEHHDRHPERRGIDPAALASTLGTTRTRLMALVEFAPTLTIDHDVVRRIDHRHDDRTSELVDALAAAPFAPPSPDELGIDRAIVRAAVRAGLVVDLDGIVFAASALDEAASIVGQAVVERGTLTVSEIRVLLASTRKFVVPIARALDGRGVTRRRGDERIAGPRALG